MQRPRIKIRGLHTHFYGKHILFDITEKNHNIKQNTLSHAKCRFFFHPDFTVGYGF